MTAKASNLFYDDDLIEMTSANNEARPYTSCTVTLTCSINTLQYTDEETGKATTTSRQKHHV